MTCCNTSRFSQARQERTLSPGEFEQRRKFHASLSSILGAVDVTQACDLLVLAVVAANALVFTLVTQTRSRLPISRVRRSTWIDDRNRAHLALRMRTAGVGRGMNPPHPNARNQKLRMGQSLVTKSRQAEGIRPIEVYCVQANYGDIFYGFFSVDVSMKCKNGGGKCGGDHSAAADFELND